MTGFPFIPASRRNSFPPASCPSCRDYEFQTMRSCVRQLLPRVVFNPGNDIFRKDCLSQAGYIKKARNSTNSTKFHLVVPLFRRSFSVYISTRFIEKAPPFPQFPFISIRQFPFPVESTFFLPTGREMPLSPRSPCC